MNKKSRTALTRRTFVKSALVGSIAASVDLSGFPSIVPSTVFGATAPSNRINVGAIGNGRISRGHDLPGVWRYDEAQVIAVCDLDSKRAEDARALVNGFYSKKTNTSYNGVTAYTDYRALLQNKDIDAVLISTPDHWHSLENGLAERATVRIALDGDLGQRNRLPGDQVSLQTLAPRDSHP